MTKRKGRWNWSAFWFVLILSALGVASNKTVNDVLTGLVFTLIFGVPFALLFAWVGKED